MSLTESFEEVKVEDLISSILEEGRKILFFIGAGFARDEDLKDPDRLPLGEDIKFILLCKYLGIETYENYKQRRKLSDDEKKRKLKELEKRFRKRYDIKEDEYITPEKVWEKFVEDEPLEAQLSVLNELFSIEKPIHLTYRLLARLMLEKPMKFYLFTTNFDEKLDDAFDEQRRNRYRDKYVVIAVNDDDFERFCTVT